MTDEIIYKVNQCSNHHRAYRNPPNRPNAESIPQVPKRRTGLIRKRPLDQDPADR